MQVVCQLHAGPRILLAVDGESGVGDHAQDMVAVFVDQGRGLLEIAGQEHLAAAAHAQRRLVLVQGLGRELLALLEQELEQVGQHRTVEPDGILDHDYGLDAYFQDVMFGVHAVLHQLDDRQDQVDVAEPGEYVVDAAQVLIGDAAAHLAAERRQHHERDVGIEPVDLNGLAEGLADVDARHGYDQVEWLQGKLIVGLGVGGHSREPRRRRQAE